MTTIVKSERMSTAMPSLAMAMAGFFAIHATAHASAQNADTLPATSIGKISAQSPAALAHYDEVLIDPVSVAFSKDWRPNEDSWNLQQQVTDADRDRISRNLAAIVRKQFAEDFTHKEGYPVVSQPGPNVLQVSAHIVDLYINAPDVMGAGRVRNYVRSVGSMTLVVELRDSLTGQLLARATDRQVDPDHGWLTLANSVTNSASAERGADSWGRQLRAQLDSVRSSSSSSRSPT